MDPLKEIIAPAIAAVIGGIVLGILGWVYNYRHQPWFLACAVALGASILTTAMMFTLFRPGAGPPGPAGSAGPPGPAVSIPADAIIAFRDRCPDETWAPFGNDHFLLGHGKRNVGEMGGREDYPLSERNIPKHQHETLLGRQSPNDAIWGQGKVSDKAMDGGTRGSWATSSHQPLRPGKA